MSYAVTSRHDTEDDSPDGRVVTVSRTKLNDGYRGVSIESTRGGTLFSEPAKLRALAREVSAAAEWLELR